MASDTNKHDTCLCDRHGSDRNKWAEDPILVEKIPPNIREFTKDFLDESNEGMAGLRTACRLGIPMPEWKQVSVLSLHFHCPYNLHHNIRFGWLCSTRLH